MQRLVRAVGAVGPPVAPPRERHALPTATRELLWVAPFSALGCCTRRNPGAGFDRV